MKIGIAVHPDQPDDSLVTCYVVDDGDGWQMIDADAAAPEVTDLPVRGEPEIESDDDLLTAPRRPIESPRFVSPLLRPRNFCIGLNYRDHATETNSPIPAAPIVFSKLPSAIVGPEEPIVLPRVSDRVDYEAELVVLIGTGGRHIAEADALDHVLGYCCGNDVSARDWQKDKPGKQWLLGKSFDTFGPVGPYVVTADEVGDPQQLRVQCRIDGETLQDGTTGDMIFSVAEIIAYLSQVTALERGDVIFTGTPAGVGDARTPPRYLKRGETVEVEIETLGVLASTVIHEDDLADDPDW